MRPVRGKAGAAALEKQLGFDRIILKLDLTEKGFKAALIELAQAVAGADVGLIDYAGHGMEAGGCNFLIPVDAEPPTPDNLDLYAIPLDAVMPRFAGVSKLKLLMLDAFPYCTQRFSPAVPTAVLRPAESAAISVISLRTTASAKFS